MDNSPFILVIFGATGDLAKNKLIPALFGLFKKNELPKDFWIVGFARRPFLQDEFAKLLWEGLPDDVRHDKKEWENFARHLFYQQGNFDESWGYNALVEKLKNLDEQIGACITRIFYLATPPQNYDTILDNMVATRLPEGCGQGSSKWTRIAIEKPFGKDIETALALDKKLSEIFEEKQIFRVDHYLGKESLQNLLVFRFANGIFDPIWNSEYIDNVQITLSEKKGIGNRGKFFDGVGTLRDVGQNHLMQLFAAVAMEMPMSFSKEGVRDARAKAIESIKCIDSERVGSDVVRGQYIGYKSEKDVDKNSSTETYVAMKFFANSKRFENIPFYMRAGKEMSENLVEIAIVFKQTCHILFKEIGCPEEGNVLKIRIQPDEGINIRIIAKTPGPNLLLEPVDMHFKYSEHFASKGSEAYEKVLGDIIKGEQILFNRSDELESSWEFIEKILKGWENENIPLFEYKKGSMGPKAGDELLGKDGKKWV
ncbi:MAG TPA: glucose-6-phosphate dehydrogenase [Patescibacteria group bacterium]